MNGLRALPPGELVAWRGRVAPRVEKILEGAAELGFLGGMALADQVDHALGFAWAAEVELGRPPGSVVDLGTGGGVPGLVLASCWPASEVALLDANQRRTDFLAEQTAGWHPRPGVEVIRARAEQVGQDERFRERWELVVARSFGPPAVTAECGAPLLLEGGVLIVSEPPEGPSQGERWPSSGVDQLGLAPCAFLRFDGRYGYQPLRKISVTPTKYPRRIGVPSKRPLF